MDVEGTIFENLDSWEMMSLFMAILVLGVALYRWLLVHWRSAVDLRAYAYMHRPFLSDDGELSVRLEVLKPEGVRIDLLDANEEFLRIVVDGPQQMGDVEFPIDMQGLPPGAYYLSMTTTDQTTLKRFDWNP